MSAFGKDCDGYCFAEFRREGDTLSGTVLRYGDTAQVGRFRERFEPRSLAMADDVIVNLMHDRSRPVARTGSGLELRSDDTGVHATITFPDTVYGREARELTDAGILRGFSLEFRSDKERWEDSTRIIEGARAAAFALVDRPAYPQSTIETRLAELHRLSQWCNNQRIRRVWY